MGKNCMGNMEMVCNDPAPYPPIKVECKCCKYANLILLNYAGMISELSAITQYVNHHEVLYYDYKDVSDTLLCIAKVEMHHLDMLGRLVVLLGGDLRFYTKGKDCCYKYWNGKYVDYPTNVCNIILSNIQGEKDAIKQYTWTAEQICDENVKKVLYRIIKDEHFHIKLLSELYKKYCDGSCDCSCKCNDSSMESEC